MGVKTTAEIDATTSRKGSRPSVNGGDGSGTCVIERGRAGSELVSAAGTRLGLLRREPKLWVSKDFRKLPRTTVGAPQEKMERIIGHAEARIEMGVGRPSIYALVVTLAGTGIPLVAAIDLKPSDVDLERKRSTFGSGGASVSKSTNLKRRRRVLTTWLPQAREFVFPPHPRRRQMAPERQDRWHGTAPGLESLCRPAGSGTSLSRRSSATTRRIASSAASVAAVPAASSEALRCPVDPAGRSVRQFTAD